MPRLDKFNPLRLVKEYTKRYANLPDRYIKRKMEHIYYQTPKAMNYLPRKHQRKAYSFNTTYRPWTNEFRFFQGHYKNRISMPVVEPILEWSFFRGDRVEVMVGRDRGKQGLVKQIFQEKNWVIVEGLNTKVERIGKETDDTALAILREKPLNVSTDIKHVDPSDLKPTDIEWRYTDDGEKVRVAMRTGRVIPIPPSHDETIDYKSPETYAEGDKDTLKADVEKVTFKPTLKTFEMDLMDKMGIKEDRVRKPTWWY